MSNTSAPLNENMSSQAQIPSDVKDSSVPEASYAIGYGRPPKHARFKPGQSGNPKGRPKRKQSLNEQRQDLYIRKVPLTLGNRRQTVPVLLAVEQMLIDKALKGDHRAAQAVLKIAKELGLRNDVASKDSSNGSFFPIPAEIAAQMPKNPDGSLRCRIDYMEMSEDDLNAA